MKYKEKTFEDSASYSNVIKENQHTEKNTEVKIMYQLHFHL